MTQRIGESAYVQAAHASAPAKAAARSTAEYRALDAAHHLHPFSDMGALNAAAAA